MDTTPRPFPVIRIDATSRETFVAFWDQHYSDYDQVFYDQNIGKPLSPDLIEKWFEWKNGTKLSEKKKNSILRFSSPDERIEASADNDTLRSLLNRGGGAIWRIFWLHLQHPRNFPIYDQHAHRAMAYLRGWSDLEIPDSNPRKIDLYLDEYLPYFNSFSPIPHRRVDRALWTFGRFLRTMPKLFGVEDKTTDSS
jgi:hypothetical protein